MTTSTPCSTSSPRSTRFASRVVATVAFWVEPSQSPSGCLVPSVSIPSATTQQRPLSSIPSSISTASQIIERAAHQLDQMLARARDELAADRRLARRPSDLLDLLTDRLARACVATRAHAGQHSLEHHFAEPIARGEVRIRVQLDLLDAVGAANARALDRHTPAAERDLTALVAVPHRGPVNDVPALRADDLVDLRLHQLVQHPEPNPDAQRQQPLLCGPGQLTERLHHRARQPLDALLTGRDRRSRYGPHGGWSSCPRGLPIRTRHGPNRTGRGGRTAASSSTSYGTTSAGQPHDLSPAAAREVLIATRPNRNPDMPSRLLLGGNRGDTPHPRANRPPPGPRRDVTFLDELGTPAPTAMRRLSTQLTAGSPPYARLVRRRAEDAGQVLAARDAELAVR